VIEGVESLLQHCKYDTEQTSGKEVPVLQEHTAIQESIRRTLWRTNNSARHLLQYVSEAPLLKNPEDHCSIPVMFFVPTIKWLRRSLSSRYLFQNVMQTTYVRGILKLRDQGNFGDTWQGVRICL
jgi:hypothetical protein